MNLSIASVQRAPIARFNGAPVCPDVERTGWASTETRDEL